MLHFIQSITSIDASVGHKIKTAIRAVRFLFIVFRPFGHVTLGQTNCLSCDTLLATSFQWNGLQWKSVARLNVVWSRLIRPAHGRPLDGVQDLAENEPVDDVEEDERWREDDARDAVNTDRSFASLLHDLLGVDLLREAEARRRRRRHLPVKNVCMRPGSCSTVV